MQRADCAVVDSAASDDCLVEGSTSETRVGAARNWSRLWPWLPAVAVAIPFAIIIGHALRSHLWSTSDLALIELRVRDVGGRYTPLVGAFSRYGWNHPGPLLFYSLAAPYRLFGSSGSALSAAGALLNLIAALGCVWVFWRRGGAAGAGFGAVVLLVLLRALAVEVLAFPWNPFAIVLPFLFLMLVVWSVLDGDDWMLPLAVAVASFCAQSHVGSAPAAGMLVVVAVGAFVVHSRRGSVSSPLRTAVVSAVVGVVLWLPPILDELRPHGGNLSALWRYWTAPHANTVGWARGARIVNAQFAIPAPWMSAHERIASFVGGLAPSWHVPWALLLLLGAGVVALRRKDWASLSLVVLVLLTAATAFVSASRVIDEPYPYLLRWTWTVGAMAWLAIGWTAVRALSRSPTRSLQPAIWVGAAAALALAVATTVTGLHARIPFESTQRALRQLDPALVAAARNAHEPILVENAPDIGSFGLAAGVLLRLNEQGIDARFDTTGVRGPGRHYTIPREEARTTIVAAVNDAIDGYRKNPAYRLIAAYDTLSPEDRAFMSGITDRVTKDRGPENYLKSFAAWADAHPDEFRRFNELGSRADREALFVAVDV